MEYDDNSRVTKVTNALGDNIRCAYDAMDSITSRGAYNSFPPLFFKWEKAFDVGHHTSCCTAAIVVAPLSRLCDRVRDLFSE
jgi:YD repeat-containing protein